MANKEKTLTYLQRPLPISLKKSKLTKRSWTGYNRRNTVDSGMLSYEKNISTLEAPYLTSSQLMEKVIIYDNGINRYSDPIGVFGFSDFLLVIYSVPGGAIQIDRVKYDVKHDRYEVVGTGSCVSGNASKDTASQRCIVQFNVYDSPDVLSGDFTKKLIIFPDKLSMNYDGDDVELESIDDEENNVICPNLKYATVHLSRLFGVDDTRVYASGFNDYTNWVLDDGEEYNENNAWCSTSQANTKAGGDFTGITTFQNYIVCFKHDFMHEVYNTKNPFRIRDIYAEGSIDNRTICDVDGQLIFVSEDNVKVYTGGNPKIISYNLGLGSITYAVSGTDGRNYYLYCEGTEFDGVTPATHFFVYDIYCQSWSERDTGGGRILGFAKCDNGFYCLYRNDSVDDSRGNTATGLYRLDTGTNEVEWEFHTDFITMEGCDIKHIDKLQADMDIEGEAKIKIIYDDKPSEEIWHFESSSEESIIARLKIRNSACTKFKLCFSGVGFIRMRSLELFIKSGGELHV